MALLFVCMKLWTGMAVVVDAGDKCVSVSVSLNFLTREARK